MGEAEQGGGPHATTFEDASASALSIADARSRVSASANIMASATWGSSAGGDTEVCSRSAFAAVTAFSTSATADGNAASFSWASLAS
jgi:hypothetical protein